MHIGCMSSVSGPMYMYVCMWGWALLTQDYHYQTRQLSSKAILTITSPCNLMVPMGVGDRAGAVFLTVP